MNTNRSLLLQTNILPYFKLIMDTVDINSTMGDT